MEREVRENNLLESGEHNGNLYGTHLDSIRDVIKQGKYLNKQIHFRGPNDKTCDFCTGKMCVLDCSPSALKMMHNSTEFMPYVIFIAAPGMEQLKQLYSERRVTGGSQRNLAVSMAIESFPI